MSYWSNGKELKGDGWDEYYLEQIQDLYYEDIYEFKNLLKGRGIKLGNFADKYMDVIKRHYVSKKELRVKEEKSINELAEKIKLLDQLDTAIEDFVPPQKRVAIFIKGLEVIKAGDEGKRQVIKAFNKLAVQYNLGQERERKLFD